MTNSRTQIAYTHNFAGGTLKSELVSIIVRSEQSLTAGKKVHRVVILLLKLQWNNLFEHIAVPGVVNSGL
jgi:hypothetical protein